MNVFSKVAVIAGLVGATTFAVANTTAVNQQALAPTQITTVKQALTLKDDTPVQLKGYVVKATGDEKYQFSDQTCRNGCRSGEILITAILSKKPHDHHVVFLHVIYFKGMMDVDGSDASMAFCQSTA